MSPLERSLKLLRESGWLAEKTEQRLPIPGKFVTRDLFGFADIMAVTLGRTMLVQTTTGSNLAKRVAKILALPAARRCLEAGLAIEAHGWSKKGARGEAKAWNVTIREITLAMFRKKSSPKAAARGRTVDAIPSVARVVKAGSCEPVGGRAGGHAPQRQGLVE